MGTREMPRIQRRHLLLGLLGLIMITVVGIGYKPAIFIPLLSPMRLQHPLISVHVVFVSLWLLAFTLQVLFAITGQMRWHRQAGPYAFGLGMLFGITGLLALPVMLRLDPGSKHVLIGLLERMTVFLSMMVCAWRARHVPVAHARYMMLGMSQAFLSGIRRMGIPGVDAEMGFMLSLLIPLAIIVYDLRLYRRLMPATLQGSLLIAVGLSLRALLENSPSALALADLLAQHDPTLYFN